MSRSSNSPMKSCAHGMGNVGALRSKALCLHKALCVQYWSAQFSCTHVPVLSRVQDMSVKNRRERHAA